MPRNLPDHCWFVVCREGRQECMNLNVVVIKWVPQGNEPGIQQFTFCLLCSNINKESAHDRAPRELKRAGLELRAGKCKLIEASPPRAMGEDGGGGGSAIIIVPVAIRPTRILVLWELVVHTDHPASVAIRTRSVYSMSLRPLLPHTHLLRPSISRQLHLTFLTTTKLAELLLLRR